MNSFLISLDFELAWGNWDGSVDARYRRNVLGVRDAIPAILNLFARYEVRATWAAVGLLLFDSKKELYRYLPDRLPAYTQRGLGPYGRLHEIGDGERDDPYHYALSLIRMILGREGMELGSHTFSHYYCLESDQTGGDFRADLESAIASAERLNVDTESLVFPCNQYGPEYLQVCSAVGIRAFRGTPNGSMHAASASRVQQSRLRRAGRLLDAYVSLATPAPPDTEAGLVNLPASAFLRPVSYRLRGLEPLRRRRIQSAMTAAARDGGCFHLWWHPHNFGRDLAENLQFLEGILQHHLVLREKFGVQPLTMSEAAQALAGSALCVS